jgi:hypothetical protein
MTCYQLWASSQVDDEEEDWASTSSLENPVEASAWYFSQWDNPQVHLAYLQVQQIF